MTFDKPLSFGCGQQYDIKFKEGDTMKMQEFIDITKEFIDYRHDRQFGFMLEFSSNYDSIRKCKT